MELEASWQEAELGGTIGEAVAINIVEPQIRHI